MRRIGRFYEHKMRIKWAHRQYVVIWLCKFLKLFGVFSNILMVLKSIWSFANTSVGSMPALHKTTATFFFVISIKVTWKPKKNSRHWRKRQKCVCVATVTNFSSICDRNYFTIYLSANCASTFGSPSMVPTYITYITKFWSSLSMIFFCFGMNKKMCNKKMWDGQL